MPDDGVRAMLGKRVRVTLDGNEHIVTGKLLGFGQGGDFEILDDTDLMVHYCWPLLKIELAGLQEEGDR